LEFGKEMSPEGLPKTSPEKLGFFVTEALMG
jgi:hypothetical protein